MSLLLWWCRETSVIGLHACIGEAGSNYLPCCCMCVNPYPESLLASYLTYDAPKASWTLSFTTQTLCVTPPDCKLSSFLYCFCGTYFVDKTMQPPRIVIDYLQIVPKDWRLTPPALWFVLILDLWLICDPLWIICKCVLPPCMFQRNRCSFHFISFHFISFHQSKS